MHVDYDFNFGLQKNQKEMKDKNDVAYQLQALLNILSMRPGTNQDNPNIGIDMSGLQFAEGAEGERAKADVLAAIKQQTAMFISSSLLESVDMDVKDVPGAKDGSKEVTFTILFANGIDANIKGIQSDSGFAISDQILDEAPFLQNKLLLG